MDLTTLIQLAIGIVGTWLGAELLVRGSVRIALGLGVRPLLVGLTVVALGTSAPEAVVSFVAARAGSGGLALGNVLGSNIANIGLILGIVGLLRPLEIQWLQVRRDAGLMFLATAVTSVAVLAGWLGQPTGVVLLLLLVVSLVVSARKKHVPAARHEGVEGELDDGRGLHPLSLLMAVVGLVLLVFGARALVSAAEETARAFGISEAVIGATMVAVGTSLPELAASIVAVARGHHEIGIGNIVGSNLMNLLFVLGGVCAIEPIDASYVASARPLVYVMLGFTLAFLPMLLTGRGVRRREGIVLLSGYGVFAVSVYFG